MITALAAGVIVMAAVAAGLAAALVRERALRDHQHRRLEVMSDRLSSPDSAGPAGEDPVERLARNLEVLLDEAEATRYLRQRLEWALDAIPQGVRVIDEAGRTVFANQVAADYDQGRHGDALVAAAVEELSGGGGPAVGASRTLDLLGPPRRTVVVDVRPLVAHGAPVGTLVVIEDVSVQRHADDVRRDFVANISHELKTPVAAVVLLAETLMAAEDPEVVGRLSARMVDESLRVSRTIDDLLELSQIENEQGSTAAVVNVDEVMLEAGERLRPVAERAGIELRVHAADSAVVVTGDHRQLVSAVANLVENAVKYSDPGSSVDLRVGVEGSEVHISVADHGIGIPARDLDRIFERFYRVDQDRSRRTGGTGLGLAIVRHVMTNHGGDVRVESRLGEGTTFTLSLPVLDITPDEDGVPAGGVG